jgi:transcriptional regulator with XRE-family HTH domain
VALDRSVSFGRAVRALRERAGHSQEAFAHTIGVHRTYMGTLERGRANPTLRIIDRIAQGLGMTVPELFQAVKLGLPPLVSRLQGG